MTQNERGLAFQTLHEADGAFVIPNPWDIGSAKLLQGLGFKALATTSAGFAHAIGRVDGEVSRDEKLAHCKALCDASELPISADLENCFADDPGEAAETIRLAGAAGLVGGSIEDYTNDPNAPIYDFSLAVERVHAAAEAARALDCPFVLTARAEGLLRSNASFDDVVKRLQAFEAAGADVLYAPALKTTEEVATVVSALNTPINVLAPLIPGASVADLANAGAKRISIGGALGRAVLGTLIRASEEMLNPGTFTWTQDMAGFGKIAGLLKGD